ICPASAAARTWSAVKVLETAISRTEAGSRPTRSAARAICSRTPASRVWSVETASTQKSELSLFLELCNQSLRGGGVGAIGRELEIGLELRRRAGEVALVHQCHAELIVSLSVVGVGLERGFECLLGFRDLSAVPQHDALIEERIRAAA